jgi:hypothetical protein
METSEMRFLRSVLGRGLRERMKRGEHEEAEDAAEEIRRHKRNWKEHVETITPESLPRDFYYHFLAWGEIVSTWYISH